MKLAVAMYFFGQLVTVLTGFHCTCYLNALLSTRINLLSATTKGVYFKVQ